MNVASLELCKGLLELSGWEDTYFWWDKDEQRVPEKQMVVQAGKIFADDTPAYDLGYLLRELPDICMLWRDGKTWHCDCEDSVICEADTPEDAAAKLAIELIRQGVISP
jgi:hypothetical protein